MILGERNSNSMAPAPISGADASLGSNVSSDGSEKMLSSWWMVTPRMITSAPQSLLPYPYAPSQADSDMSDSRESIIKPLLQRREIKVYKRRWYILSVYCMMCVFNSMVWNSMSPIAYALQMAYGWSAATVALLVNWSPIAIVTFFVPYSFLFSWIGTRYMFLLGALLLLLATSLRAISTEDPVFLCFCHMGHFINGAVALIPMTLPPLIAALWFPVNERILATALAQSCFMFGNGLPSLIGPLAVPFNTSYLEMNSTDIPEGVIEQTKEDIHRYMSYTVFFAAIILICILIYFPDAPPLPPSDITRDSSFDSDDVDSANSWRLLLDNTPFLTVHFVYVLPGAIQFGWLATLSLQLKHLDLTAEQVGLIGFAANTAQALGILTVGLTMDRFRSVIKEVVVACLFLSASCYFWLALITLEVVPLTFFQLFITAVVGSAAFFSCLPLFFELALMVSGGASEALVGTFMAGSLNIVVMTFLSAMMLPSTGFAWVTYVLLSSSILGFVLICTVKTPEDYVTG